MARPKTSTFSKFVVLLGDGVQPTEGFTNSPCGLNSKQLALSAATSEGVVNDCDDPEAAAWTVAGVTSKSATLTGSGLMAMESFEDWRSWWDDAQPKNIRVQTNESLANHGGYWQGPALLTDFTYSTALGTDGNRQQVNVTIKNADAWVWHPAAS